MFHTTLRYHSPFWAGMLIFGFAGGLAGAADEEQKSLYAQLDQVLAAAHRDPANAARDRYRHPRETLLFFGLRPDMEVLEIAPGRGWYTELLAPLLRNRGALTVASFGEGHPNQFLAGLHRELLQKMSLMPEKYDRVRVVDFHRPDYLREFASESVDMVLTFRNTHNWLQAGVAEQIYRDFFRVLRPGGILGVVQHRAAPGTPVEQSIQQGYVPETYLVQLVEQAGFILEERSEINANPLDTRDHPEGVWTLPPTFRLEDRERDKYAAIGESDRSTLRFRRPDPR